MVIEGRPSQLRQSLEGRPAGGLPPHDISAEEAVVAALLLDEDTFVRVLPIVQPEDFYREQNGWIYEACLALGERNERITVPTIAHELDRVGRLDSVGGEPYLVEVAGKYFTAVGVEAHARIIARDSLYRRLIGAAQQIAQLAYAGGPDVARVLGQAETMLLGLRTAEAAGDFHRLRELLDAFLEQPDEDEDGALAESIRSGFMDLDALLGGFKRGDLVILAARTGVGKTSLLLNLARNAAVGQHATVAVFSLEMSGEQLAMRLLSAEADVEMARLRLGRHTEQEEHRVMHAHGVLGGTNIFIDDSAVLTVPEIRAKCRRLQAEHGLDLVVVDYLQLLHGSGRADTRTNEISQISRALKELARELNTPVIAAAQLSRAVESRHPHIPMLSDLRESGSIEQDADIVTFIYREDVYLTPDEWQAQNPDVSGNQHPSGLAQIIVAKHRNGPTGTVTVRFRNRTASFQDLLLRADPAFDAFDGDDGFD
ncbi:MAG: replicative DNA helicase [Chloroflexi bacterium]|nr:replicative DNA helicase [Chloroflexota bacterium]MDA1004489.1 replicative DNA helicase [Chloroflexota bacterium]